MARTKLAIINHRRLLGSSTDGSNGIELDSPAWFDWLTTANSFSFESERGNFTARREQSQTGKGYWKAYRRYQGKLYQAYLGKSEDLSYAHLDEVADLLQERIATQNGEKAEPAPQTQPPLPVSNSKSKVAPTPQPKSELDLFVTTKLHIPSYYRGLVARPRLAQLLGNFKDTKLVLVTAPAGFGKTTLVVEWLRQISFPAAWLSLDSSDNEPQRFWFYLFKAFESFFTAGKLGQFSLVPNFSLLSPTRIITKLINDLVTLKEDVVLVLDDYHLIESEEIQQGMKLLLEQLPARLHLIITSRALPNLPLARLRVRQELIEIKEPDLRFTLPEIASFVNQELGRNLPEESLAVLESKTDGWVAGLQLVSLSLKEQADDASFIKAFKGTNRYVLEYLAEEVLKQQSEEIQNFLLQTSLLDRLCAPLVEAVTGCEDGQAMLEELERANLFLIALDDERRWYRYHHLFAEYLRSKLKQEQSEHMPLLYRWAAQWYEQEGLAVEAVDNYLLAQDYPQAIRLFKQISLGLSQQSKWMTLLRWLEALPKGTLETDARLSLDYAWVLDNRERIEQAEFYVRNTQQLLEQLKEQQGSLTPKQTADLGEAISLAARFASRKGQLEEAVKLSARALEFVAKDNVIVRTSIFFNLAAAQFNAGNLAEAFQEFGRAEVTARAARNDYLIINSVLGMAEIHLLQGQLMLAAQLCQRALKVKQWGAIPIIGAIHLALAEVLYEWNQLEEALANVEKGLELLRLGGIQHQARGLNLLVRIRLAQGDKPSALAALTRAEKLVQNTDQIRSIQLVEYARLYYWLATGEKQQAGRWAEGRLAPTVGSSALWQEIDHLRAARVLLWQGRSQEATRLLDQLLKAAQAAERTANVIRILSLQALALYQQQSLPEAFSKLSEALRLAEPAGFIRLFADEGESMAALLTKFQAANLGQVSKGYLQKLQSAFNGIEATPEKEPVLASPASKSALPAQPDEPPALTERELAVLRLLAGSLSSTEIAQHLSIAPTTTRTHIQNIYTKLGVNSRYEAVARARTLRLV